MIAECPIHIECQLVGTLDFANHKVFIERAVATYCQPECLTDGTIDTAPVQPLLFCTSDRRCWRLGDRMGRAWEIYKT
jgi:flavin reductase (DIM6/NTAB) family NADH-FMN oxidoreductase RutF